MRHCERSGQSPPPPKLAATDADLEALKTLVAPIVDKVSGIKRVEGDRVD